MARQKSAPADTEVVRLVIPSKPEMTMKVDLIVEELIPKFGFDSLIKDDIAVAVNEVVKNAILHGNQCDARKKVEIIFTCEPSRITIRVRDYGNGFDLDAVPDPLDPENLLKESGRGLLILRVLMDEVSFHNTGHGTEVTLVKYGSHR
ncbi:MAG: ATP-binding protein [Candidatus Latescibacteria bacterium]|nr:ATP-binding protein [Candidatus Latescibacterota bacterium]